MTNLEDIPVRTLQEYDAFLEGYLTTEEVHEVKGEGQEEPNHEHEYWQNINAKLDAKAAEGVELESDERKVAINAYNKKQEERDREFWLTYARDKAHRKAQMTGQSTGE